MAAMPPLYDVACSAFHAYQRAAIDFAAGRINNHTLLIHRDLYRQALHAYCTVNGIYAERPANVRLFAEHRKRDPERAHRF